MIHSIVLSTVVVMTYVLSRAYARTKVFNKGKVAGQYIVQVDR